MSRATGPSSPGPRRRGDRFTQLESQSASTPRAADEIARADAAEGADGDSPTLVPENAFWYGVLNMFPFVFLPIVAIVAVLASLLMRTIRAWLNG